MAAPPYKFIGDQLNKGKVIPFLGSAASIAGVEKSESRLPDGRGLARELISTFGDYPGPDEDPLTKVSQFCQECVAGRAPLYDALRNRFYDSQRDVRPAPAAGLLAAIDDIPLIVTTNYDRYLEKALDDRGKQYTVLTHVTNREHEKWGYILAQNSEAPRTVDTIEPGDLELSDFGSTTVIYKIHGTFSDQLSAEEDTLVITENDYVEFLVMTELKKFPPSIATAFQKNHILFLGYSLEDWNFRVILQKLQLTSSIGANYRSWAMQLKPTDVEKRFWQKRDVDLYDVDLRMFVEEMERCLVQ